MAIAAAEKKPVEELPVLRADELSAQPIDARLWLIRDLWLHQAVGWCAGAPKSGKTFFACEMAISVASGAPCLGHFVVEEPGPTLIYLAEDSLPRIHDRIAAICSHRKIDLAALDLYLITVPRLQLDLPSDLERLDATVARIKPHLLLLDCLSRLHARDESSASEMSPLLGSVRELSRRHNLAITICHHVTKRGHQRHGQALRGSGDLWAFADSSAYLNRRDDRIEMVLEHRSAAAPDPVTLSLVSDSPDQSPHLEILATADGEPPPPPLGERVRTLLADVTKPLSRAVMRKKLSVNNQRLGEALVFLERHGMAERSDAGWCLAKPAASSPTPAAASTDQASSSLPDTRQISLLFDKTPAKKEDR
jgi:hypothetical protein